MNHTSDNCGWAKLGSLYCVRKKRRIMDGECPYCKYWVLRTILQRVRKARRKA